MPTYEYACKSCGEHLEVQQSFSDDALTECPNCGGQLRKVFGNVGVTFKGSGFYKNDSRKTGSSTSTSTKAETGTSSTVTETKSAETKADSKPAETKPAETKSTPSSDKAAS